MQSKYKVSVFLTFIFFVSLIPSLAYVPSSGRNLALPIKALPTLNSMSSDKISFSNVDTYPNVVPPEEYRVKVVEKEVIDAFLRPSVVPPKYKLSSEDNLPENVLSVDKLQHKSSIGLRGLVSDL